MAEWDDYEVTLPSGGTTPTGTAKLETVHHVVHIPAARRILEDEGIRAGLVYDESRLNKARMSVVWLSANTWAYGSIYGNVQFSFPWETLAKGRRFYWVEAMDKYSPPAYRILMTDRDLSSSKRVTSYDPKTDGGPLKEQNGEWFWNTKCTSEFMIDRNLDLSECSGFEFITHNPNYCRLNGQSCPDRAQHTQVTAGRLLAFILGNDLHGLDHILKQPSIFQKHRELADEVDVGISGIWLALGVNKSRFKGTLKKRTSRQAVLRGALALYGSDQKEAARDLVSLLSSQEVLHQALEEVVKQHFDLTGWTIDTA